MHVPGQWIAKIVLEIYILTAYGILIQIQDWQQVSLDAKKSLSAENECVTQQTMNDGCDFENTNVTIYHDIPA